MGLGMGMDLLPRIDGSRAQNVTGPPRGWCRPIPGTHLAVVAYERVAAGARVRSFLPVLAEREARQVLQELSGSN
jgi:hypothetical protein